MSLKNVINSKDIIIQYFLNGCKKNNLKIGTEHEKFLFNKENKKPISYRGNKSILKIFLYLKKFGWKEIREGKNILGLTKDKKNITLEPGLQLELSGVTVKNIHE
ncbi:MAG: glutamate--cysteine ligase, partial [Pelagibacterales bacterium]|nr:glutamate--cysteine ligase [Pelagibacterales bacterium]